MQDVKTNLAILTRAQAAAAALVPAIYDAPDPLRVWGLSVSPWSHKIDWQVAKEAGCAFAIIKFMDGKAVVSYADANYKGAKDAGLLVGGYTWLYRTSVVSNGGAARAYLDYLTDHPCDIRPCVDFEWTAKGNPTFDDLYGFSVPFSDGYGRLPMIYTARGYWNDPAMIAKNSSLGPKTAAWADYPPWAAEYRNGAKYTPFGLWGGYKFLQWSATGNGALYGYPKDGEKEAELNYWPGTYAELVAWCNGTPPVPVPTPPGPSITSVTIRRDSGPDTVIVP